MDAVEEIKRRIDPVTYIGRFVRLQKSGRNFRGLCPFHSERTPSFYVFPDRGTWRCFGACGEGGDLFTFVQKREGVGFREALELLAREAGVSLSRESGERRERRERLAAVISAAVAFYQAQLAGPAGAAARQYLEQERGLSAETIAAWKLGWAPDEWRALRDHLAARGYSDEDMVRAGLLVQPEEGGQPYDRFRGRVIIPIADERGVFVALAGRILGPGEPKYLNSPQTELFDKGRLLFGLDKAAEAVRAEGTAVVVEGYMDVIGPWQAGFRNVVATMGTALTMEHARVLRRYARRVVLAMDPDAAGLAAAERAGEAFLGLSDVLRLARSTRAAERLAHAADVDLFVAPLPAGVDPDELARRSPEEWRRAIAEAVPFPAFALDRALSGPKPSTPQELREAISRVVPILLAVRSPVEQARYVQRAARKLATDERYLLDEYRAARRQLAIQLARETRHRTPTRSPSREDIFLAMLLRYPALRESGARIPETLFGDAMNRELFRRWRERPESLSALEDEVLAGRLRTLEAIRLPPLEGDRARRAATEALQQLIRERQRERLVAAVHELRELEERSGVDTIAEAAWRVWHGEPSPTDPEAVEKLFETVELGRSLHRSDLSELP